jgi:hypothetical protein
MPRNPNEVINDIQKVRTKNNELWMQLLRIAMQNDPEQTKHIMKKIRNNDLKISSLTGELADE